MAWLLLFVAGVLEVVWAYTMKLSQGFTRPAASIITLPLGTAYTVWTGIGAVGAFLVGITALGEPVNATRIIAAMLILSGIVLMKASS